MELRKKEVIGGIFMLLAGVVLLAVVVFVGKKQGFMEKKVTYRILFEEVGGLREGASVTLSGVTVGFVDQIQLVYREQKPYVEVSAVIFEKYLHQIRKDSEFSLSTIGVLGDTIVKIAAGSKESVMLASDQEIFGQSAYSLKQFTGSFEQVVMEIAAFSKNVKDFLNVTSREIAQVGPELTQTSRQVRATALQMEKTTRSFEQKGTETLAAIRDASRSIEKLSTDLDEELKKGKLFKFRVF